MSRRVSDFTQNLRSAFGTFLKSAGCTTLAISTLASGIDTNTAISSYAQGVLLKPLPYAEPDRIMRVLEKPPGGGRNGISTLNFLDWQKGNNVFEYMAAQTGGSVTLTWVTEPVQPRGSQVSPRYFDIFGIKTVLGR